MASNRRRYRQERVPARRRHINHVELVLQHLVGQAGHPLLVEGLPIYGRLVAMALLANEEDKDAIEVDESIGEVIAIPLLRSLRLPACVEQLLGENGLLEGP